ncbi:hypothetical protein [Francisella persica]
MIQEVHSDMQGSVADVIPQGSNSGRVFIAYQQDFRVKSIIC